MMDYRTIVALVFVVYAVIELRAGKFFQPSATLRDWLIEGTCGIVLPLAVIPAVLALVPMLLEAIAPTSGDALAHWTWWQMFLALLVVDDLTQYLWHRASHASPTLFRLHRAHHSAAYMSVRITYRNNVFYYAMMPGLWLSAACVHLGFGPVYAVYAVLKMLVVMGAHASVPWDGWLLARRWTWPLLWLLERTISTPTTHAAHHGRHADDDATHYRGNYGNFLFLWDVLFGTAKITRRVPRAYGLEDVAPVTWVEELAWPLVTRTPRSTRRSTARR
jgi:sterol desaturase/sphingolipid hydroxylase (fatty acid hydroxylase superfamily)